MSLRQSRIPFLSLRGAKRRGNPNCRGVLLYALQCHCGNLVYHFCHCEERSKPAPAKAGAAISIVGVRFIEPVFGKWGLATFLILKRCLSHFFHTCIFIYILFLNSHLVPCILQSIFLLINFLSLITYYLLRN